MKIVDNIENFRIKEKTAIAIGKFDGIHIGHQMLIQQMIDWKKEGLKSVVVVFYFPNTSVFEGIATKEIMTKKEKRAFFEAMGIDVLVEFPLNEITSAMSPLTFIQKVLLYHLNMNKIVAGADISYGYEGRGDAKLLAEYKQEYNYDMVIIDKVCYQDREISSTYIREEVEKGNLELAAQLLGAPYSVTEQITEVIFQDNSKKHIFALSLSEAKLLPPKGMYHANVIIQKEQYKVTVKVRADQSKEDKPLSTLEIHTTDTIPVGICDIVTVELLCAK